MIPGCENLHCAICGAPITDEDFGAQNVVLMIGVKEHVACHAWHIADPETGGRSKDYHRNVRTLAVEYARRNGLVAQTPSTEAPCSQGRGNFNDV
jgi:hypothetical protein